MDFDAWDQMLLSTHGGLLDLKVVSTKVPCVSSEPLHISEVGVWCVRSSRIQVEDLLTSRWIAF